MVVALPLCCGLHPLDVPYVWAATTSVGFVPIAAGAFPSSCLRFLLAVAVVLVPLCRRVLSTEVLFLPTYSTDVLFLPTYYFCRRIVSTDISSPCLGLIPKRRLLSLFYFTSISRLPMPFLGRSFQCLLFSLFLFLFLVFF